MGSYEVQARSSAPPERVFDVLADRPGWVRWTRPEVTVRDRPRRLAYRTRPGLLPVRDHSAEIDLDADGTGTLVRWRGTFRPLLPGTGFLVERLLDHLVGGFAVAASRKASRH